MCTCSQSELLSTRQLRPDVCWFTVEAQEQSKGAVAVTTEPALYKAAALISWIKGVKMSNQPVINRQ